MATVNNRKFENEDCRNLLISSIIKIKVLSGLVLRGMMMAEKIRKLANSEVEVLSRIVAECMTGSQMNEIFRECGVRDTSNESTKWKRIYYTFLARQEIDGSSNAFLNFIKKSLKPVRFINGQNGDYDEILLEINKPLMLIGLQMTNEGKLLKIEAATTILEVERRTRDLVSELQKRHIHQDVIKCCKEEYLQENYFHAIFEAAKSLSEKVREKTGMQDDGSNLFNNAFAVNNPRLAINSLQTPSERNAQNGLKEMLNGVTHMVRNVTAHELQIKWIVNEQDAIDILTTISFLHKQLDECFVVPQHIAYLKKGKDKIEAHIIRYKSVIEICLIQNLALSMIIIIDMSHGII